jgi:curved DNA-binding protein CbpA
VLGLDRGAGRAAVRDAFHRLSMRYHPDRYSLADLPDEVSEYLEAMARRVNAAYELLSAELARDERQQARHAAPVYEKARPAV